MIASLSEARNLWKSARYWRIVGSALAALALPCASPAAAQGNTERDLLEAIKPNMERATLCAARLRTIAAASSVPVEKYASNIEAACAAPERALIAQQWKDRDAVIATANFYWALWLNETLSDYRDALKTNPKRR